MINIRHFFGGIVMVLLLWALPTRSNAHTHPSVTPCTINGSNPVTAGNTYTYLLGGSCTATSWTCSCGEIQSSDLNSVTINFNNLTCGTATITAVNSGSTVATLTVTVNQPPTLVPGSISNPSQTINYNTTPAQISASASTGGSCDVFDYQWYSSPDNSTFTAISGATAQNYQPGALTATTYFERSTQCGIQAGYTSNVATVTVYAQLNEGAVTPSGQTINYNTTASTLTAPAATGGSGTYTYQWYSSPDESTWTLINGATGSTYSPGTLVSTTYYNVVASSNGAQATSAAGVVNVLPQLVAGSISPASQNISYNTAPSTLSLSGTSGGNGSYSYQWYSSPNGTTGWSQISGATSTSYTPGQLTSTVYYQVQVTSNGVVGTSGSSVVNVAAPPLVPGSITPASQTINYNTVPAQLVSTAASGGNGVYTYQWLDSSAATGGVWSAISGATSTDYTPGSLTATTWFKLVTSSGVVSDSSGKVVVTVYPALVSGVITPASEDVGYNTSMGCKITIPTGGAGGYTYQWYSSTDSVNWSSVNSTTNPITHVSAGSLNNLLAKTYVKVVSSSNGASVTSIPVVYSVDPPIVSGVVSPTYQVVNYNTPVTIVSTPPTGGNGVYSYQWNKLGHIGSQYLWGGISGATSLTLNLAAFTTAGTYYYDISYTSNGGTISSATDTVVVYPALVTGTVTPASQTINYNSLPQALTASTATGGSGTYTYQWVDSSASTGGVWQSISGATALTYTPSALIASTYFRLVSTSNGASVNSSTDTITVYPQLVAGTISAAGTTSLIFGADPGDVTSAAPAGGNGVYSYQWDTSADNVNWLPVSGATGLTFDPGSLYAQTYVRMAVTSNGATALSNVIAFSVGAATNAPVSGSGSTGTATVIPMPGNYATVDPTNLNYIRTRTLSKPGVSDTATADALTSVFDALQSTEYFDGLGRSMEVVAMKETPGQTDLITPTFYDPFGRVVQQYQPYTDNQGTGQFRTDDSIQQPQFYNTFFNNTESYYYSTTTYEASELGRTLQQTAPGNSWTGSNRGVNYQYRINTSQEAIRYWTITYGPTDYPVSTSTWPAGNLTVDQTVDEQGHQTLTYTDMLGHMILKKIQEAVSPSSAHDGWLCTYYVYDDLDNLRFVIPPKAVAAVSNTGWDLTSVKDPLCFQYAYDSLQRMSLKKVPGANPAYMIYNQRNLLVMSQDGNLMTQNQWEVTKYDSLNRAIQTGIYQAPAAYSEIQMQQNLNNDQSYPESYTLNTQTFYDNYTQVSVPSFTSADVSKLTSYPNSYPYPVTQSTQTLGLVTTTQVRVLEAPTTQWLTTVNYYDDHNRVIQSISDNISGSRDTATTLYDFSGKALSTYERHNNALSILNPRTTVLSAMTYDHVGRVLKTTKQLNDSGPVRTIDSLTYDALGQLQTKTLGNNIESLNYTYNIRGWLTGINKNYLTGGSTHYYGMELDYDYGFSTPQYNGNISGIRWKSTGNGTARAYGYLYDNINRLIAAPYLESSDGTTYAANPKVDFSVPEISYDPNGNILTMNQNGLMVTSSGAIDQLSYTYPANSNQLQSVTDSAPVDSTYHLGDFQDGNTTGADYTYDLNGNLGRDNNKHIDSIRYNYLNLPEYVHIRSKGSINYVYDADGVKYEKIVVDSTKGGSRDTTMYIGSFVYHSDTLQFLSHEEGRIRYLNKVSQVSGALISGMVYDYFLKDHLGDTRMVLTEENDTTIYAATMEASKSSVEDSLFNNINTTQYPTPTGFEPSSGGDTSNHYVSRVNGGTGGNRVGPSLVLKVMATDTVSANVYGWYQGATQPPPSGETPLANDLLSTLTNDVLGQGGERFIGAASPVSAALVPALASFFSTDEATEYNAAQPKAFLNWVLFDEQMNFVSGGVTQVPSITGGVSKQILQASIPVISKNGYIYIYVSNESQQDVFFDNLNVQHRRGPITEEEHYYPFGLTMAGISDQALVFGKWNRYRYNGIELDTSLGFDDYETKLRDLDPQTGRWWQVDPKAEQMENISPYASNFDDPIKYDDPNGDCPLCPGFYPAVVEASDAFLTAAGVMTSSGSAQEVPSLNALGQDIKAVGSAIKGASEEDVKTFAVVMVQGVVWYNKAKDFIEGNSNKNTVGQPNTTPAQLNTQAKPASNIPAGTPAKNKVNKKQPGSYTNTHQSGMKYHGKGTKARSQRSGREKEQTYGDPHVATDWTPSPNSQQALKDENARIQNDGGIQNPKNYNIINSPGKNIP